ncbi:MAG: hypothetical protein JWO71_25 [Candidatus Acidoferrum typicum]|nr:hypothetical protein [Candidatus Acidoferrum typicum]
MDREKSQDDPLSEYSYTLLFKCPKCDWWITSSVSSPVPIRAEELNEKIFKLECPSNDCDWTGSLVGHDALGRRLS